MTINHEDRMTDERRRQRLMAAGGLLGELAKTNVTALMAATTNAGYPSAPKS